MPTARFFFAFLTVLVLAACGKGTPITSGTPTPPPTPPPAVVAQYPIPTASSKPGGITLGSDGNLWFTEFAKAKIGQLIRNGSISESVTPSTKSQPLGIASGSGPNLNVWFTESSLGRVAQITVAGPPYVEYQLPATGTRPTSITLGSDGNMWVTDPGTDSVWKIQSIKHKPFVIFTQYHLTTHADPGAVTSGPDGAIWFTEAGIDSIGRLPVSGSPLSEFAITTKNADPAGIAPGNDNGIWFTELKAKQLGRMSTGGTVTAEYPLANAVTPDQLVQGVDGNFYFTDTAKNKMGQFYFKGHRVLFYSIPTANSAPTALTLGLDSQIYFVESAGNKIGQFRYFNV